MGSREKSGGLEVDASPYIPFLETKKSNLWILCFVFSKELMNKPVSLPCGHSACKDCMLQLVRSQGRSKSCSLCRTTINQTQFNISVPLQAIIAKIKVQCTVPGCSWSGEHQEKESHQAQCEYSERKCQHGCVGSFRLAELNDHNGICPYKRVKCRFCEGMYHRFSLPTHEEICVEVPQPCPLNCGECIPRLVSF